MTAAEAERLRGLRAEAAQRLIDALQAGKLPVVELREMQERLRLLDGALAEPAGAAPRPRRRAFAVSLLGVALLTSLAALIEMPAVPFSLELQAGAAALQMAEAGELGLQSVNGGRLRIEGFDRLESADAALVRRLQAGRAGQLDIAAASLQLRRIAYPAGSLLRLQAGAQAVRMTIEAPRPPVVVEAEVAGQARIGPSADDGADPPGATDYGPGEWLRLSSGEGAAAGRKPPPLAVVLAREDEGRYAWSGLRPVAVRLVERQVRGAASPLFVSSLVSARISLPATGGKLELPAGAVLEIDGLSVERCQLTLGRELRIELAGSARAMRTRIGDFERSLKPSLLEFLARNHTVELLWGAALFLWGGSAWLRRQFDGA